MPLAFEDAVKLALNTPIKNSKINGNNKDYTFYP